MADFLEVRRYLTEHWQVLDYHYLKQLPPHRIAQLTQKKPYKVGQIIRGAWDLGITWTDVANYMKSI